MIYLMLFFADVIWGLNIIVTKLNYSYFHPVFLVFLKLFFALLTMLIILRYKNIQLKKTNIKELIINANCIHVINFLLTYYALKNVKGVMSASINTLAPLVMMIITFFYQKKITKSMIILLFFSIFGFLCTIHFQIMSLSLGHFLLIIALFFYNFGNYRLNKVNDHLLLYNTYMLLISLIEITFVALFYRNDLFHQMNSYHLWLFILTSGIGYAYIQCVYFFSIHKIGPLKTSVFMGLSPILTSLFSIAILKEEVDCFLMIGFFIIFITSIYYIYQKHRF